MELSCVTLENGLLYGIVDTININNNCYVFLSNINDDKDFCIRQRVVLDQETFLIGLTGDNLFDDVMAAFKEKNDVL
ncbi:MAG: hypothetical protein RR703_02640 [Bacilli bacterium]